MASPIAQAITIVGLLGLVGANAVIGAVAVRFFRLRLSTTWGVALYTLGGLPVFYTITTLFVLGVLGIAGGFTLDTNTVVMLCWLLPASIGISIDVFWVPPPEELPDTAS